MTARQALESVQDRIRELRDAQRDDDDRSPRGKGTSDGLNKAIAVIHLSLAALPDTDNFTGSRRHAIPLVDTSPKGE